MEEPGAVPLGQLLAAALAAHERADAASRGVASELASAREHLAELEDRLPGRLVASEAGFGAGAASADTYKFEVTPAASARAAPPRGHADHPGEQALERPPPSSTPLEVVPASSRKSVEVVPAPSKRSAEARRPSEGSDLWHVWAQEARPLAPRRSDQAGNAQAVTDGLAHVRGGVAADFVEIDRDFSGHTRRRRSLEERIVLRPDSGVRTAWEVASLVLLSYDVIMMPLSMLDRIGVGGVYAYVELAITLFWTMGIGVSFISAYYDVGALEVRLTKIARRYLRGTFLFDVSIVSVDWLFTLASFLDNGAIRLLRLGKLVRFGKAARMLRLLRIMKVPRQLDALNDAMQSQTFSTAIGVGKAIAFIIILNHFVACIWYSLSNTLRDYGELAWVDALHNEGRDKAYFYTTSLHWSLTQSSSSMEIVPRNTGERVFVIVVVVSALLIFSSFVSGITSAMTHLRQHNNHRYTQLDYITRYLLDKKISGELSSRIAVFIRKYKFLAKHKVREQDVEVFQVLPTPLKRQLRLEAHGPVLCRQPFFYQLGEFDGEGLLAVCNNITELPQDMASELFTPSQDALDAYFLLHGHAEYDLDEETWFFEGKASRTVFCEAALWVRFAHPGRLFCRTSSEFLALSSATFRSVVPKRPMLHLTCCDYAQRFLLELHESGTYEQFDLGFHEFDTKQEMAQTTFEASFSFDVGDTTGGAAVSGQVSSHSDRKRSAFRGARASGLSRAAAPWDSA
ncbi:unnamed protein product [Prorocentrum cordatum]|uniref:Ion transport domain-containing protein n=1 Tax=Prorocentrum cordatum TaxID=2364126 RepID=A0ABN9VUM7_9DINO|nr:unnamed protein product [Polarella glacialis]CAK0876649.1 unnamed protein product [Polarella glacialis]